MRHVFRFFVIGGLAGLATAAVAHDVPAVDPGLTVGKVQEIKVVEVREIEKVPPVEVMDSRRDLGNVQLSDQVGANGSITGVIANRSEAPVQDIKLLVDHVWHWKNEMKPGEDNPGRARYVTIPGLLPPGNSVEFRYEPVPSLPYRSDGYFETKAQIVSFDRITYETVPAVP